MIALTVVVAVVVAIVAAVVIAVPAAVCCSCPVTVVVRPYERLPGATHDAS